MQNQQKNTPVCRHFPCGEGVAQASAPVAVMDSGVGGIGVLREIRALLPNEELLYFGDSANAPYGGKPRSEVKELILSHAERLLERAKALVIACNTATALAVTELRSRYPKTPIIGMEPALKPALAVCAQPRVLVLATATTLRERKFVTLLKRYEVDAHICCVAAPALVDFVENGAENSPEAAQYLSELLQPYRASLPDAVVLGCTHFPFAKASILHALGADVPLFDGAKGTAKQAQRKLCAAGLLNPSPTRGAVTFTSSDPRKLGVYAGRLFGE